MSWAKGEELPVHDDTMSDLLLRTMSRKAMWVYYHNSTTPPKVLYYMAFALSKFSESTQCKQKTETDLEGDVVVDRASQVDSLYVALHSIDRNQAIPSPCRELPDVS